MKSLFAALTVLTTLPGIALAQFAHTPEHYVLDVGFSYDITLPRDVTAATQAGVPLSGKISFSMTFPRPDCLGYYDARQAIYSSTQTDISAFNRKVSGDLSRESWMIVQNDTNGEDLVQLTLRGDGFRLGGQRVDAMVLRTFNLPPDALRDDTFIADGGLLKSILEFPQLQAYVLLGNSGSPTFFMQTSSFDVKMKRVSPARPGSGQTGQFARCNRP